jgi:hypothetical protein
MISLGRGDRIPVFRHGGRSGAAKQEHQIGDHLLKIVRYCTAEYHEAGTPGRAVHASATSER